MKKILFYSDCILFGGSENVLVNLMNNVDLQNTHEMYFAFWSNDIYVKGMHNKISQKVHLLPLRVLSNSLLIILGLKKKKNTVEILKEITLKTLFKLEIMSTYNLFRMYYLFIKIKPDIVYINNGGYPGAESCRIAAVSARLAGVKKIIFNVNNLANEQTGLLDRLKDKYIEKSIDIYITASIAAKKQLSEKRGINIVKIINIENTIPIDFENITENGMLRKEFNIDSNSLIIGTIGLLTIRKGYNILIDAINIIKKESSNDVKFYVFIFGEGEERLNLENQILQNNLQKNIFMPGYRKNINNIMNEFDVFVLPSVAQEDFPYVIVEAMALGKPVIGTRIAGIPEQIDEGLNGFLVEPNNANQLASAIKNIVRDHEKISTFGKKSKEKYNKYYNYAKIMEKYLKLINC